VPAAVEACCSNGDPFRTLDPHGVGPLVATRGRRGHGRPGPTSSRGSAGSTAASPASIALFDAYGLDHVSCSPGRVKVARLAAARATLGVEGPDRTA
jgi:pyruvate, orthophosphate dikinase